MSLESSRTLGGIGSILMLIGALPVIGSYTFGIIALIGLILIFIALYRLANLYNERGIFNNALYGLITAIVGVAATVIVAFAAIIASLSSLETFISQFFPGWTPGDWTALSGMTPTVPTNIDFSALGTIIAAIAVVFIVAIVFAIVTMYFFRRSLQQLSAKSAVGMFSTAGLTLFIGAFLLILLVVPGLVVMWIGVLLMTIAFFRLRPQQAPMTTTTPPPTPTTA